MMKKFLLCPSLSRDDGLELTKKVYKIITEHGGKPVVCPLVDRDDGQLPDGLCYSELEKEAEDAFMAIAFGGDGTILRTVRAMGGNTVPVLAVNMGNIGFMAELDPENIQRIEDIFQGNYRINRRMMIDVSLERNGEKLYSDFALNDVVIKGVTKVIDLEVSGDGQPIYHFSGDGAVVATPTGSTAYSMSAGGPIVEPDGDNIIITPICAHALLARSFVLSPERRVSILVGSEKTNSAYMSGDGREARAVRSGDVISICVSNRVTELVQLSNKSFYRKVYEKLGEKR